MNYRTYCVVSGALFSLVALAHLLRVIYGMSVQVDEFSIPMILSWVGFVIPACLAFWAFRIVRESVETRNE
jgi:hypothetical protein